MRAELPGTSLTHRPSPDSVAVTRSSDRLLALFGVFSQLRSHGFLPTLVCLAAFVATSTPARAGVIVDGNLADWGITTPLSDVTSNSAATTRWNGFGLTNGSSGTGMNGSFQFQYMLEDTRDNSNSYWVGPNSGGQNYDAEFLGVGTDNTRLVIAIISGQRPDNGENNFSPGDIIIETDQGFYAIEVGGGYGYDSGGPVGAITEGAGGSTYALTSNGHTKGVVNSDGTTGGTVTDGSGDPLQVPLFGGGTADLAINSLQKAGTVWRDPTLIVDPISNPTSVVQQLSGGQLVGTADYHYSLDASNNQHSVIEVAIPYWMLSGLTIESVEWAPSCGNDLLKVTPNTPIPTTTQPIPEPSTLALLGMGGLGIIGWRRKRKMVA